MNRHIKYQHIFESVSEQKEIADTFIKIMNIRKDILDEQDQEQADKDDENNQDEDDQDPISLPGAYNTGPSTV